MLGGRTKEKSCKLERLSAVNQFAAAWGLGSVGEVTPLISEDVVCIKMALISAGETASCCRSAAGSLLLY